MITQQPDTDVLIVGAGPAGLSLAAALQRLNIRVRLIEQKPGLSDTSKATNLMQGTQEQLASYDLIAPMTAASGRMRRLMIHAYGTNLSPRSVHLSESLFPTILLYGQDRIEASLADAFRSRGGQIEFNTRLVGLVQDSAGITATLTANDQTETVRASFAVGCDGPRSATRTFTTCDFTPVKTGRAIRQVDARLRWKRLTSMEQMWLFYEPDGFVVVVPLLDGYTRILSIEPKANMPDRDPTLAEMQDKLRAVTGDDSVELTDCKWFSHTELSMGIAPALRDGRVLLAGDAGNPILPNGGQGLNTGIQDSLNLGWKLAAVIRGQAPDRLLDTYQAERLTLRQGLEKIQYNSLKYTTVTNGFSRFLISRLGNFLLDRGGEYQMARAFSELNVNYRKSNLTLDAQSGGPVRAGDRPANAEVIDAETGAEIRLFDRLSAPVWKLVCFNADATDTAAMQQRLAALQTRLGLVPMLITTSARHQPDTRFLYYDLDELAHKQFGIKRPTLLLIRPDQYVAVRLGSQEWDKLNGYITNWFTKN